MDSRYPSTGAATKARAHRFSLRCSREDLSDGGGSGPPPAEWLGAPSGRTGAWEVADVMVDSFVAGGGRAGSGSQVGPPPTGDQLLFCSAAISACALDSSSSDCIRGCTSARYSAAGRSPSTTGWMFTQSSSYHSAP